MKCETNKSPLALLGNLRNPARTQIQNVKRTCMKVNLHGKVVLQFAHKNH